MSERVTGILDAACRVIVRGGIERLRMSDVASEAGVSTALVHYYFATRAELIERAFHHADDRADRFAEAEMAHATTPAERLERLLGFQLANHEAARASWVLWRELWTHALFDGRLRAVVGESYLAWVGRIDEAVREAAVDAGDAGCADPPAAGARLAALVDGLGEQLELGIVDHERARELLRGAIALELGERAAISEAV